MSKTQNIIGKHWCFTYNNPTQSPDELIALFPEKTAYLVFQKERGELEGTIHYQGYVEFSSTFRISAVRKIVQAHWTTRVKTRENARDYCMKQDATYIEGPWELGTWTGNAQGKRTDLEELYKLARTSKTLLEVAEACPSQYMRYYKAVQHVRQLPALDKPKRSVDLKVFLYYGAPGTGKTRSALYVAPDLYSVPLGKDLWFDNYCGEPDVLIDDFSGNLRLVDTLRLLDRYPIQVPVKGGFVYWCPERIFITTNVHPSQWYDYTKRKDSYAALTRRITDILYFKSPNNANVLDKDEMAEFFNERY